MAVEAVHARGRNPVGKVEYARSDSIAISIQVPSLLPKAQRSFETVRTLCYVHSKHLLPLKQCRMGHYSDRLDPFTSDTPSKLDAPIYATPVPPNTLDRIYSVYRHPPRPEPEMPRQNIGEASAKKFAEFLSGPILDIFVGSEGRHWSLHQNLLIHHARFFDETYTRNGEHRNTRINDGKLDLHDQDPGAFELLVKWMYQGKIDDVSWMPKDVKWDYAFTCQKLYLLCDTIGLLELKNQAIDQFRRGCHEAGLVPGPEEMTPVYEKTPPSSPFRKLVAKIAARQIMDPGSEKNATSYRDCFVQSPDFAVDVINAIKEGSGGSLFDDPTEGNGCRYHEHEDGENCHKTVKFKGLS